MVEQRTENPRVGSSNLPLGIFWFPKKREKKNGYCSALIFFYHREHRDKVEQRTENPRVGSSNLPLGIFWFPKKREKKNGYCSALIFFYHREHRDKLENSLCPQWLLLNKSLNAVNLFLHCSNPYVCIFFHLFF